LFLTLPTRALTDVSGDQTVLGYRRGDAGAGKIMADWADHCAPVW
jgi:hypothetical protein